MSIHQENIQQFAQYFILRISLGFRGENIFVNGVNFINLANEGVGHSGPSKLGDSWINVDFICGAKIYIFSKTYF